MQAVQVYIHVVQLHQTIPYIIIGASLSEPHIDVVVLLRCTVCIYVCMYVCMYVKTVGVRTV